MSEAITAIEQDIIEDFELFDEWAEKYEYVIEIGRKLSAMDDKYKTDSNKIKGCQSSVWMITRFEDGRIYFEADSDSTFVKGLIAFYGQHHLVVVMFILCIRPLHLCVRIYY